MNVDGKPHLDDKGRRVGGNVSLKFSSCDAYGAKVRFRLDTEGLGLARAFYWYSSLITRNLQRWK